MNVDLSMDLAELDFAEIGAWPGAVKALCFGILAMTVLALGYLVVIGDKRTGLAGAEQREVDLRHEFGTLARTASGLGIRRAGLGEATAALDEMLARLPVDTEVPGLVEDISRAALDHDLVIDRIELGAERQAGFHRELPITIGVVGDYHDIGGFAADIAGLPRLVTLHDFDLTPRTGPRDLDLTIEARTYRYAEDAASAGTPRQPTPPRT
ncbi:MAG: type 4a pilus biogenesis protein PilO [Gammaproteobacteria bacterium]|nr:type 4a pilus biogenesis protein PilO [Gammaproteobacteria bacterium]